MLFHRGLSFLQQGVDGVPFQRLLKPGKISPKTFALFNEIHLKSMIGNGQGRRHAGNAAADNQRFLNDPNGGNGLGLCPFKLCNTHFKDRLQILEYGMFIDYFLI